MTENLENEFEQDFLKPFINYDTHEIKISKYYWKELNEKYSIDEIKDCFVKHIFNGDIGLPMIQISEKEAFNDFKELCRMSPLKLCQGKTYTKAEYKYPISNLFFNQSTVGNKASNYFQQYNRMCCAGPAHLAPTEVWKREKSIRSVLSPLWTLKMEDVNTTRLMSCIALRSYIASQFKPIIAKSIYSLFGGKKILDTSSGWGDRLCGFFATEGTEEYMGVDPNTALHPKYKEQIKMYQKIYPNKKANIVCDGAEYVDYPQNYFDLCFTSPPYFKAEKYSTDEKQTYLKYSSQQNWLEGFLYVMLKKAWNSLKDGGYLIINISDIYDTTFSDRPRFHICDPMTDYVINELKGSYVGCIGMRLSSRPNMQSVTDIDTEDSAFIEPIWVYYKGSLDNLDKHDVKSWILNGEVEEMTLFDF